VIARLKPGASIAKAQTELDLATQRLAEQFPQRYPATRRFSLSIKPLLEQVVGDVRRPLIVLLAAVGCVLLIACANVASLLLTRAAVREREIAIRTALGAARVRIIRQLLTESVLLAFLGGLLGLGLSWAATRYFTTLADNALPRGIPIGMDARVLLFMAAISVVTGILFGIFPALHLSKTNVNQTLRDEGRGSTGGHSSVQLRGLLVVGQVTLSLILLIAAGLLIRSFSRLLHVDPGFDPQNVFTMNISLPTVKYADAQKQVAFFDDLLRRVSALPGVRSTAIYAALPLVPKRITPVLP